MPEKSYVLSLDTLSFYGFTILSECILECPLSTLVYTNNKFLDLGTKLSSICLSEMCRLGQRAHKYVLIINISDNRRTTYSSNITEILK